MADEVKEFKDIVVDFRARHDLSMKQMAELAGVTEQTIFNIENRLSHPTRLTVSKILQAIKEKENKQ